MLQTVDVLDDCTMVSSTELSMSWVDLRAGLGRDSRVELTVTKVLYFTGIKLYQIDQN